MGNALANLTEDETFDDYEDIIDDDSDHDTPWESSVKSDPCFATERQEALRSKLGLTSPEMKTFIQRSEFVSLGSHCRVSMGLENMGLRKAAHPFDWVRSSADGVLRCLESNFADFLSYSDIKRDKKDNKYFFGTSWGGSFWHHDIQDNSVRETFQRRIDRFLGRDGSLDGLANRVFVRVVNSPEELALAPKLRTELQGKLPGVRVYLLLLVDMQKHVGLLHVENTSSDLLFYHLHEDLWLNASKDLLTERHEIADAYAVGIGAALLYWVLGKKAKTQPASVKNLAALASHTAHFEGGDCRSELYRPQRLKEPVYVRLPQGQTPTFLQTNCFGKDRLVPVPPGCGAGAQLELRLVENTKDMVTVKVAHPPV